MVRAGLSKQSPASGLLALLSREEGDTGNYCSNIQGINFSVEPPVMEAPSWPYFDPDYETTCSRFTPPRVVIENDTYEDVTVLKVHSANRHGILLNVVQVLTDLDLKITKSDIFSDGGWFMDVFHLVNQNGNKIRDQATLQYIQKSLGYKTRREQSSADLLRCPGRAAGLTCSEYTVIELTGPDRPGLLSEISAVLTNQECNVNAAEVWTHNLRVACVIYFTDSHSAGPVKNKAKLGLIKELLSVVMKGDNEDQVARIDFATEATHVERRLHQMMSDDRRSVGSFESGQTGHSPGRPIINIQNRNERGYSMINIQCKDRPKLLFDIVCTLTDMQYVIFHATINSPGPETFQDYYIRHVNGCTLDEAAEQHLKECLEAAINRRTSEGVRLELCSPDKVGLLSYITKMFREHGLSVARADVATRDDKAVNVFYVTDPAGNPVDMNVVEAMRKKLGHTMLQVKGVAPQQPTSSSPTSSKLSLGGLIRSSERFLNGLTNMNWRSAAIA
jgi:UTP:GlnB (protein PII) uridylyltransferase